MPIPQISKDPREANVKEADIKARGIVNEGKDTEEEIVKKFIEAEQIEEKRKALEQEVEEFQDELHKTILPQQGAGQVLAQTQSALEEKSEFLIQVENILSGNLGDAYMRMEGSLRERFKQKGEEVARKIEAAVASGKARIKQIVLWIKEWLKMVPGVNRFFLEQEAKIKGDKILAMLPHYS